MADICDLNIKNCCIGRQKSNICVPLLSRNTADLLEDAEAIKSLRPDMFEWRADYFAEISNPAKVLAALERLSAITKDYPVIFTYRDYHEGGFIKVNPQERASVIKTVINSGLVDLVDVELQSGQPMLDEIIQTAHEHDVYVILSYHDFEQTPSHQKITEILLAEQEAGADLGKIAVMPKNPQDVLRLMDTVLQFNTSSALIPVIAMSMSQLGMITRISGCIYGSAVTYAAYDKESAPGQIPVKKMHQLLAAVCPQNQAD